MIYNIVKELERTSSTKIKQEVLNKNRENKLLKEFFRLSLDSRITFFIKKIPSYKQESTDLSLEEAFQELGALSSRLKTGQGGIDHLTFILENLSYEDANIIERVIKKDPNCKVAHKTVNKVWPKLVLEYPTCLCSPLSEKVKDNIKMPSLAQIKEDGVRINIVVQDGKIEFRSRSGKYFDFLGYLEPEFTRLKNAVYDGEALVTEGAKILNRQIGNGIINKAIKGTISEREASTIIVRLWDMIPIDDFWNGKCNIQLEQRLNNLQEEVKKVEKTLKVFVIESRKVDNWDEAQKYFEECLEWGKEGIIIKNFNSIWENKRLKNHVKMKSENDCDLICVGIVPHKKNPELIGSLTCETSDGKLKVDVGSGLSDDARAIDYIGEIIAVRYNSIIENKNNNLKSLYLPRFLEVRQDKTVADKLEELK